MGILSLITVRRGSKGVKNKCIREINGKRVFEYIVDYSLTLGEKLDGVVTAVSSDSPDIKEYCTDRNIPFVDRSEELASDHACIEDVILDAYRSLGRDCKYISLLYGNIPTRYPSEFIRAYDFLEENPGYDAAMSLQECGKFNPAWMFRLDSDELPAKEFENYRRQDLEDHMIHDGHTILFRTDYFLEYMNGPRNRKYMYEQFGRKIKPVLNNELIIDIDCMKDFELANSVLCSCSPEG